MIQWYPGHMEKAKNQIKEFVKVADIIYLVLDARAPRSSFNPVLFELVKQKPVLYLYNKSGLTDLNQLNTILKIDKVIDYLVIDSISKKNINQIRPKTLEMLAPYIAKKQQRGYKNITVKALVLGIPNVGKSTLINTLAGRKIASTNKLPGHTRRVSWINIKKELYLLDTPGVLWPKFEEEKVGYHLALSGAIKEEILKKENLSYYAFEFLLKNYQEHLFNYYQIDKKDKIAFFEELAIKRGFLQTSGRANLEQAYTLFLNDIKQGNLGGICFD